MGVKEGLAVKLLNVHDGGTFQTAAQSLLRATFVSNERLQHRSHHVQLHRQKRRKEKDDLLKKEKEKQCKLMLM